MKEKFYLGTYTKRESKGVYSVILNKETKQLENLTLEAVLENPTYLYYSKENHLLFAVGKEHKDAGVTANLTLTSPVKRLSSFYDQQAVPCYIRYNERSHDLLTANYHGGFIELYHYDNKNHSISFVDKKVHSGSSIHENQTAPHVHYTDYTPDEKWIVVCDLGIDTVFTYKRTAEGLEEVAQYKTKAGSGPRHLAFHPTLPIAYLICELDATVEVLSYNNKNGTFRNLDKIALTTEDQQAWGGAIHLTRDGRFVYASNRGFDALYTFSVDASSGLLTLVQTIESYGSVPRDFHLSNDEAYVVVGHQESDNLTLFKRDLETGELTLLQKDFYAPEVVCVVPQ